MTYTELSRRMFFNAAIDFHRDESSQKTREALEVALICHREQVDKSGEAYIKHIFRVAGSTPTEYIPVALLHDVFEDFLHVDSEDDIKLMMPLLEDKEVHALWLLTRQEGVQYETYIRAIADSGSEIAIAVKIADIKDHLRDTSSLSDTHIERYKQAFKHLNSIANV